MAIFCQTCGSELTERPCYAEPEGDGVRVTFEAVCPKGCPGGNGGGTNFYNDKSWLTRLPRLPDDHPFRMYDAAWKKHKENLDSGKEGGMCASVGAHVAVSLYCRSCRQYHWIRDSYDSAGTFTCSGTGIQMEIKRRPTASGFTDGRPSHYIWIEPATAEYVA